MAIDYNNLTFKIPERSFADEFSLMTTLKGETPAGNASEDEPTYLFRGQSKRFATGSDRRNWPANDKLPIPKHTYLFESIIPTDYRNLEKGLSSGVADAVLDERYGMTIARVRTALTLVVAHEVAKPDVASERWINANLSRKGGSHKILSLGQHYGLPTQYLDATSSWETAIWFATRDFASGSLLPPADDAVIYRFDRNVLEGVLDSVGRQINKDHGLVSICDTPAQLGRRAFGQNGWSIIGLEHPEVLSELVAQRGIEALQFRRTSVHVIPEIDRLTPQIAVMGEPLLRLIEDSKAPAFWTRYAGKLEHTISWPRGVSANDPKWATNVWS